MLNCIFPQEMKVLEAAYMEEKRMPSILLMEHAAQGVLEAICRHTTPGNEVVFLCGPGANGGDGYASARLWAQHGGKSVVLEVTDHVSGDALLNRSLALEAGCVFADPVPHSFSHAALVVDALFGTGLSREVEGKPREMLLMAGESHLPCIAVDIPSGLHGENGHCLGPVLHCVETVTFHRPKTGLFLSDGPEFTGTVTVHPILIPRTYGDIPGPFCMECTDLADFLPPRSPTAHKGTFGRTLIFAGSKGMAGAAAMCASAAVRSGSGLTTLLCTPDLLPILQMLVPAATCIVLPDETAARIQTVSNALAHADRAVIGCGLSQDESLLPLLTLFRQASCPVIWDADALNLLSRHPQLLPLCPKDIVTPHPGEAARLLNRSVSDVTSAPLNVLRELHKKTGAHVLLKGACTLMTNGHEEAVNILPCPALAKGGSGDILSGILAALVGRVRCGDPSLTTLRAMQCAVLIHTLAGRSAAQEYGEDCVTPQAVIESIRLRP